MLQILTVCVSVLMFDRLFAWQGFNQLSELAMMTKFDVGDMVSSEEEKRKMLHAVSLLHETCEIPTTSHCIMLRCTVSELQVILPAT